MRKLILGLILAAGVGIWFSMSPERIAALKRFTAKLHTSDTANEEPAVAFTRKANTIRIASFDIQNFGPAKLTNPAAMKVLCDVARRFDVIAVQDIHSARDDLLPRWVDAINATGRHFEFVPGPRLGREPDAEQLAFVFDAGSVEIDRGAIYTVDDPQRLVAHDPLVASFRVRGPAAKDAFTFTLVNIHVDSERTAAELTALAGVYQTIRRTPRDDGLIEDDVIVLGNFNADDRHLGPLGQVPNTTSALAAIPTLTRGTRMCDNILFSRVATIEYTGRAGVLDLAHEFNLPMKQTLEVSDHLPVWAEFSIYEGGQFSRLAERPERER